jgi:hypothetical protein
MSNLAPILLVLYNSHVRYDWDCVASGAFRRSGRTLAVPIGEAGRIRSANKKFSRIFFIFAALRLLAEYESQSQ